MKKPSWEANGTEQHDASILSPCETHTRTAGITSCRHRYQITFCSRPQVTLLTWSIAVIKDRKLPNSVSKRRSSAASWVSRWMASGSCNRRHTTAQVVVVNRRFGYRLRLHDRRRIRLVVRISDREKDILWICQFPKSAGCMARRVCNPPSGCCWDNRCIFVRR